MRLTHDPTQPSQSAAGESATGETDVSAPDSGLWFAILALASVALYRPLVTWAQNAWDLAAPAELFNYGLAIFGLEIIAFLILSAVGVRQPGAVLGVAGSMFLLLHWETALLLPSTVWLMLILGVAVTLHLRGSPKSLRTLAVLSAVIFVLAPAIQTVAAHVVASDPYPITDLAPRAPVNPTGHVEDVLLVVVDSYPSLLLAEEWFHHDTDELVTTLTDRGLTVEESAWSHNTFTGLAIPGLLELKPIVSAGPSGTWGNRRSTFDLIRGENLVATSLQSAGFEYTHVESGWDGAHCGANPDVCLEAPWFNEISWNVLESSILRPWLLRRYGNISVPGSLQAVDHLESITEKFEDGNRDFVFAHLLLPHAPVVVDDECRVLAETQGDTGILDPEEAEPESIDSLAPQLGCVDSLLARIAVLVGDSTAVVITSDHGPGSRGQVHKPPNTWSDADIAERLGIMLAYKVPRGCQQNPTDSSIEAMRMVVSCAVDMRLPLNSGIHLIGAENPVAVEPARMANIEAQVNQGLIRPDES